MIISWRLQRQFTIFTVYTLIIILPVAFIVIMLLAKDPSCFDGKLNGNERGVDCGGNCLLQCEKDYNKIRIDFSRAFLIDENRYAILALLNNYNNDVWFPKVPYKLSFYGNSGDLLGNATGTIFLNPQSDGVIYLPNLNLKQKPKVVDLDLGEYSGLKYTKEIRSRANINTWAAQKGANNSLQIIAEVINPNSKSLENLTIYALLYDDSRSIYTVGKTELKLLKGRERTAIAYTWGNLPKPTNVEFVIVYGN